MTVWHRDGEGRKAESGGEKRDRKKAPRFAEEFATGDFVRFPDGPPIVRNGPATQRAPSDLARLMFFVGDDAYLAFWIAGREESARRAIVPGQRAERAERPR